MLRFEVTESKKWKHADGRTASIYGSVPYVEESDKANWQIVTCGWTIRDNQMNTIGIGRRPFATREEAQAWVDEHNAQA